jgi:drug/metabolite transporter (DMT)-like permease
MSPAFLAALAALTIYASLFVVGRVGVTAGLDSFDQSGVRFAVSTILLLPLILTRSREAFRRLGIGCALGITILGGSPYSIIFLSGFMFAPVSYGAAIVPGLQPVVVMLLSYVSLKERPNTGAVVGSGLSLLGVVVMIIDHQQVSPGRAAIGIAIFVAAAFVWGCYAFAVRLWSVKARDVLALVLPISALLYIPPYLAVAGLRAFNASAASLFLQIAFQGVILGICATFLYAYAIEWLGSTRVSALSPLMPVLATLMALFLVRETPTALQWWGISLVTAGLVLRQGKRALVVG